MFDTLASLTTFATKHPLMLFVLAVSSVFATLPGGGAAFAAEGTGKKILVAYFSHSGNTREIATQIHEKVGGDIFEIKAVHSYPAEYNECVQVAKREQQNDERPQLATEIPAMTSVRISSLLCLTITELFMHINLKDTGKMLVPSTLSGKQTWIC